MTEIHAVELLAVLQKVEERGAVETADRGLILVRQIWDYWLPTAKVAQRNITEGLKKLLTPYRGGKFVAIVEAAQFGELLQAMAAYKGGPVVRTVLQLAPLLYQRPGNLRMMEWVPFGALGTGALHLQIEPAGRNGALGVVNDDVQVIEGMWPFSRISFGNWKAKSTKVRSPFCALRHAEACTANCSAHAVLPAARIQF